jgi:hypothetical protein
MTSAARQAGGWHKVLGPERATEFKRLTSQLLTQVRLPTLPRSPQSSRETHARS